MLPHRSEVVSFVPSDACRSDVARIGQRIYCTAAKMLGSNVGLVFGGVSNLIVFSARFLITSLREVPDNIRHFEVYMLTFDVILISTQRL